MILLIHICLKNFWENLANQLWDDVRLTFFSHHSIEYLAVKCNRLINNIRFLCTQSNRIFFPTVYCYDLIMQKDIAGFHERKETGSLSCNWLAIYNLPNNKTLFFEYWICCDVLLAFYGLVLKIFNEFRFMGVWILRLPFVNTFS